MKWIWYNVIYVLMMSVKFVLSPMNTIRLWKMNQALRNGYVEVSLMEHRVIGALLANGRVVLIDEVDNHGYSGKMVSDGLYKNNTLCFKQDGTPTLLENDYRILYFFHHRLK